MTAAIVQAPSFSAVVPGVAAEAPALAFRVALTLEAPPVPRTPVLAVTGQNALAPLSKEPYSAHARSRGVVADPMGRAVGRRTLWYIGDHARDVCDGTRSARCLHPRNAAIGKPCRSEGRDAEPSLAVCKLGRDGNEKHHDQRYFLHVNKERNSRFKRARCM